MLCILFSQFLYFDFERNLLKFMIAKNKEKKFKIDFIFYLMLQNYVAGQDRAGHQGGRGDRPPGGRRGPVNSSLGCSTRLQLYYDEDM